MPTHYCPAPLLRARAIENQAFVIAPNQGGQHSEKRSTWGHSMIVDPWGSVLSCRESGPGLVLADLDLDWQQEIRHCWFPFTRGQVEDL